ncbi:MAG: hypothetical protein Q7R46_01340 [bacterium]|nr:hypothetical protein [bacterium]
MKRLLIFLASLGALSLPYFVFADYSYSRSPAGSGIQNPVNINITSFSSCNWNQTFNAWRVEFYQFENGESVLTGDWLPLSTTTLNQNFNLPVGDYSAVGFACWDPELGRPQGGDYLEGDETGIIFTVAKPSLTGSQNTGAIGISNNSPEIKLTIPIAGTHNKILVVDYSAFDPDSDQGALKPNPIIIFYSNDGGSHWNEIAKDIPNNGTYNFDTATVPDGENYRIRVVALDGYDYFRDVISGTFSIDNTGPTFDIAIGPLPVREKDQITLKITSSEELKGPPVLRVVQKDTEPKTLAVSGSKGEFSASYDVQRGSGKAIIYISGEDLTGNIGEIITSGGSFQVGLYGPPPPIINNLINNQVFIQKDISIAGSSRANTKIILTLNGVAKFTSQSEADGSFKIDNVALNAANKGYNTLSIVAVDEKGEESGEVILKIKLNVPPKISSDSIIDGEKLSGQKDISWTSSDQNGDRLIFSIEYSSDEGNTWDDIVSDFSGNSYTLDTLQLADGSNNLLRIMADDGTEKTSVTFKDIIIKNNLPHISLDIPADYFINTGTPAITGKAVGSEQSIVSTEYSLDDGATLKNASALDGEFNSLTEKFKISFPEPLKEGKHTILIKTADASNRSVKISRSFTVDTIPPFIEFPLLDKVVDKRQVDFQGKTEPRAKIELVLEKETYKIVADEKGEFSIKGVILLLHGSNKISLTISDLAKNITKVVGVVILNNPPQISILDPKEGDFLGGVKELAWKVQDLDSDPIVSQISYQKKDGKWITLAENIADNTYKWDALKLANGEYIIKIISSDGMSASEEILNIFIDNVAPRAAFSGPSSANTFKLAFNGEASDDFSGIQYVEYSFDNTNWYKTSITKGYQTRNVNFSFRPRFSQDGDYKIMTRATDGAGNIAYSEPKNITIDTTPPRIGSILITSGALALFPDQTGALKLFKNTLYKVLLSVEKDAKVVSLSAQEAIFNLDFNKAISLWESEISFPELGDNLLTINAKDEAGNSQAKEAVLLKIISLGVISDKNNNAPIAGANAALSVFDRSRNSWSPFDAQAFGQENPQKTNNRGEYGFLIPSGRYRLEVSKRGYGTIRSQELEVENNYLMNADISLTETAGFFNKILDYLRP